jgi:hypothetical protein
VLDVCVPSGSGLNDGQWHSVQLGSAQGRLTIAVDQEEGETAQARLAFPVTTGSHLFFGGKQTKLLTFKAFLSSFVLSFNLKA